MSPELFLLEMAESDECQKIMYKRLAIKMFVSFYYSKGDTAEPFMVPFRDYVKEQIQLRNINVDELVKYMIENDESNFAIFFATTMFQPKEGISNYEYYNAIAGYKILTPFVSSVDMNIISLMVVAFVLDNFYPRKMDITEIIGKEIFIYPTNQYGLTNVNGAIFKRDGLLFDGKGYYYNYFTNTTILHPLDNTVGFVKIIQDEAGNCDMLYRLDERLAMPASEYHDYSGVSFAKYRGPHFNFSENSLDSKKTIIVHYDENTLDKLLMVIKKGVEQETNEEFWHIEIETLPYKDTPKGNVITTFLHGMFYPKKNIFTHIDYTKNQYDGYTYLQKYNDANESIPIDQYTETKELHYKIWCIENGEFTMETWYKLMMVSLSESYQVLLNEILSQT